MVETDYKTVTNWKIKSLSIAYTVFWLLIVLLSPQKFSEFWDESSIVLKLLLMMTIGVAPLGLLESFVKEVTFTPHYIEKRSMFFTKIRYNYSSIVNVYFDPYLITINFPNNKKLTVRYYEGKLDTILSIIKNYCLNGKLVRSSLGGVYITKDNNK